VTWPEVNNRDPTGLLYANRLGLVAPGLPFAGARRRRFKGGLNLGARFGLLSTIEFPVAQDKNSSAGIAKHEICSGTDILKPSAGGR